MDNLKKAKPEKKVIQALTSSEIKRLFKECSRNNVLDIRNKAIQIDGGSEFQDAFEEEYQRRSIRLFVLPPRSPELNAHAERAQRTHTEEFYEVTDASFELGELNQALLEWEKVYNTIQLHQALG